MQTTSKINKFLMVITLLSGSFITAFSETLLNNGFPTIMQEVHVSEMTVQWLSTGYMLAAGVTMPLAAYLTNTIKLRHLFTTTMSLFLTGTIIAAAAPNFPILLIGRLIEGVAVGVNMPLIPNVLSLIFSPQHRGTVMGLAGIIINFGPAVGPTFSGVIVDYFSWRMLFIILIPISVVIILMTQFFVKNAIPTRSSSLDIASVFSSIVGLALLLYGLGRIGETGRWEATTILLQFTGALIMVFFVRRQLHLSKPLLEIRVFKSPSYRLGALLALLNTSSLMATELMLPLFNQNVLKVSPTVSGLMLIPSALAMVIVSPIAGHLYDQFGIKAIAWVGFTIGLATTISMAFYSPTTSVFMVTTLYAIRCGSLNLAYSPVTVYGLNALSQEYVVYGNTLMVNLNLVADAFANALAASTQVIGQQHAAHHLPSYLATVYGFHWSFWSIAILNFIAVVFLFKLKNRSTIELK